MAARHDYENFDMKRTLAPGDVLYEQGESNASAFLISEGTLALYRMDGQTPVLVEKRSAGAMVGDTSILLDQPRAVTVKADTAAVVYEIPAERILERLDGLDPVLLACVTSTLGFVQAYHGSLTRAETAATPRKRAISRAIACLQFEDDLRAGLKRDEFYVDFQPIVEGASGQVVGCEALMRWNHPTQGLIRPDRFITLAEDLNAVWNITEIALTRSCRALQDFRAACGRPLYASINVSAHDLGRPHLLDFLNNVLDQNGLSSADIRLELTESALIPATAVAETNLERLRNQGFGISIDDFGTGYSNLGHLQLLPIRTLKIDRSFANGVHASKVAQSLVRMLMALGKELEVDVVAEGVEDVRDVSILRTLGCHYFQGFYYHKPMDAPSLLAVLEQEASAVA